MKVNKMIMGGCSAISSQALEYSEISKKFCYFGDAHAYIFDTVGQSRLDSIIPFCEKTQSLNIEEQKSRSMLQTTPQKLDKARTSEQIASFIFGFDPNKEIWGGVGIVCVDWHPTLPNLLAAVTLKTDRLEVWQVVKGIMVSITDLKGRIQQIKWNPHNENQLLAHELDSSKLWLIDHKTGVQRTYNMSHTVTMFIWHPRMPDHVMYGTTTGLVRIQEMTKDRQLAYWTLPELPQNSQFRQAAVRDIIFSPGEECFLTVRSDDQFYLFGMEYDQVKMTFEKPQGELSRLVWVDSISGDFLVSSYASGVVRIYNAAIPACKQIIKVSRHGIYDMKRMNDTNYILKLRNGQVTQFNIRTKKTLFTSDASHTHQIQRAIVHPDNANVMASVGFDGSFRKWNLKNMQMELMYEDRNASGRDKIIQSFAWCRMKAPPGEPEDFYSNLVCLGSSGGTIKLVDLMRNKILQKIEVESGENCTVFALDWNEEGLLAIGKTDDQVDIIKLTENKTFENVADMTVNSPCRTVSWSPIKQSWLACGLFNGNVVIYDSGEQRVRELIHSSLDRIVCVAWHPQFEYIIAAGGFDGVVRVHDISANSTTQLAFHTDRVRSLQWNSEVPWLLTSGGDDSQQAVWDIRNQQLIYSSQQPTLAMTSFTSHPEKPFSYFSSHFDASIIQWTLHAIPDIALVQLKFLLALPQDEILGQDVNQVMLNEIQARMTGAKSLQLYQETKSMPDLDRCERILKFFMGLDGQEELWAMAHVLKGDGPCEGSEGLRVHHISDVSAAYSSKAQSLLQANPMSFLGTAMAKREDRMKEAARLNLISGNFQQYCEIQMQLGNYEDALSVAPKVSMKYWQKCLQVYRQQLMQEMDQSTSSSTLGSSKEDDPAEQFIEYSILAGDYDAAASTLEKSKQTQAAKTVKFVQLAGGFPNQKVTERHRIVNSQDPNAPAPVSIFDLGPQHEELKTFTDQEAQRRFVQNEPLLAAATHLSLADTSSALQKLVLANLPEFALVIAKQFMPSALDAILVKLFNKTVFYQQMSLTNALLQMISNRQLKEVLETSLYLNGTDGNSGEIRSQNSPQSAESTVFDHIVGQRIDEAVKAALLGYQKCNVVSNQNGFVCITKNLLEDLYFLSFIDMSSVEPGSYQSLLSLYRDVSLLKAAYWRMLPLFRWIVSISINDNGQRTLTQSPIFSLLKDYANILDDNELHKALAEAQAQSSGAVSAAVGANMAQLEEFLAQYEPYLVGKFTPGSVQHLDTHRKKILTRQQTQMRQSLISGKPISVLDTQIAQENEGGQEGSYSLEDALDLSMCMAFNPLNLEQKERFNPFKMHFDQQQAKGKLAFYV